MERPRTSESVCINGLLVPAEEARVSAFDSGFLHGVGLFETMRAYAGQVFRATAHLERLIHSARALGWSVVPEMESLAADVDRALEACGASSARVRLTVTSGSIRAADIADGPHLTMVTTATAGGGYAPELYVSGATALITCCRQSRNDPLAGHKTTSYFSRLAALRQAHASGATEAIWFTEDNHLAEGSISNVFLVIDGELHTPPLSTPVLPGIARATVLECARAGLPAGRELVPAGARELAMAAHIAVNQEPLTINDLLQADEVFLTNSMMEVLPVVRIERSAIGDERPGPITRHLQEAYRALVREECGRAAYE